MKKNIFFIPVIIFTLLSCTTPYVLHLKKNPWKVNKPQTLKMNYLDFHYTTYQMDEKLYVIGRAYPLLKKLPKWGSWVDEIWLGVYLSDSNGRVLAQDIRILSPQKITPNGFPFSFVLKPKRFGSPGPLYITFGYRLKITNFPFQKNKSRLKVFFAIQKAQDIL